MEHVLVPSFCESGNADTLIGTELPLLDSCLMTSLLELEGTFSIFKILLIQDLWKRVSEKAEWIRKSVAFSLWWNVKDILSFWRKQWSLNTLMASDGALSRLLPEMCITFSLMWCRAQSNWLVKGIGGWLWSWLISFGGRVSWNSQGDDLNQLPESVYHSVDLNWSVNSSWKVWNMISHSYFSDNCFIKLKWQQKLTSKEWEVATEKRKWWWFFWEKTG